MSASPPRLEDHVRMFHADCGGIVIGPLDDLVCAECGAQMNAFVAAAEETELGALRQIETNAAGAAQPKHEGQPEGHPGEEA